MLLLRTNMLPEGRDWVYELKLDGFRAEAIKTIGAVHLRSRNDKDFNVRFPRIVGALSAIPDETVIDGDIVALDQSGRPSFNALQNYGSTKVPVLYDVFDLMILAGKDVMAEPMAERRDILRRRVLAKLAEPIRESPELNASLPDLISSVRAQVSRGWSQSGETAAMSPASGPAPGRRCASTKARSSSSQATP